MGADKAYNRMNDTLKKMRAAVAARAEQGRTLLKGGARPSTGAFEVRLGRRARYIQYRWVLVVFAVAVFYNAFIVSDVFVTDSRFYVKSTNENAVSVPNVSIVGGAIGGTSQDALLLQSYIHSKDMLELLQAKLDLRGHYASDEWDFLSRLEADAPIEEFLSYYRSKVSISIQPESNILQVRARAFDPEFSQAVVDAVIDESGKFINSVSQNIALQETQFIEGELKRARDAVDSARADMIAFQAENELLDPSATGAAIQAVVNEMEGELVRLEAEEKILSSYLQGDAAELVTVRSRISGLRDQLEQERDKFAGQGDQSINQVSARFQELRLTFQFATDLYKVALQALERARVESYRQLKHLVVIQSPRLPDKATLPRKLYDLTTLFVILNLVYGIAAMIIATIREHRDV